MHRRNTSKYFVSAPSTFSTLDLLTCSTVWVFLFKFVGNKRTSNSVLLILIVCYKYLYSLL